MIVKKNSTKTYSLNYGRVSIVLPSTIAQVPIIGIQLWKPLRVTTITDTRIQVVIYLRYEIKCIY